MSKVLTHREQLMKTARGHARLALLYADDGAYATASKLLRETAELFDEEQQRIYAILNPSTKEGTIWPTHN